MNPRPHCRPCFCDRCEMWDRAAAIEERDRAKQPSPHRRQERLVRHLILPSIYDKRMKTYCMGYVLDLSARKKIRVVVYGDTMEKMRALKRYLTEKVREYYENVPSIEECENCGGCGMIPGTLPDDDVMNSPCPKCNPHAKTTNQP